MVKRLLASKELEEERKKQIYIATIGLAIEKGMSSITMAAIAKKAGLSQGAVYIYFPSKEDLLRSCYIYCKNLTCQDIMRSIPPRPTSLVFQLQMIFFAFIEQRSKYIAENHFMDLFSNSDLLDNDTKIEMMKVIEPIMELIHEGKRYNFLKPVSDELLISYLMGVIKEVSKYVASNNNEFKQGEKEWFWAIIRGGIFR